MPSLFIWGTQDLISASPRKASARHRLINANHSAPVTEAEQVAEIAVPFLSSF
jgi:pimeloyl-ACP methyl ester carboxylesterase